MRKGIIFLVVFISMFWFVQGGFGQPTPGDSGLGAASGNVVGGGADLGNGLWFWLLPAMAYFVFKKREQVFQWYLDLNW